MRSRFVLLAVIVAASLFTTGCSGRRDQAIADSAASIYEAATAVEQGVDPAKVMPTIRLQAWAIIRATERTYPPADREFTTKETP